MSKIEIDVDLENNEGTESPWWMIIDPNENMSCSISAIGMSIRGPFFSRGEAERALASERYNFSDRAGVWCASGHRSGQYQDECRRVERGE